MAASDHVDYKYQIMRLESRNRHTQALMYPGEMALGWVKPPFMPWIMSGWENITETQRKNRKGSCLRRELPFPPTRRVDNSAFSHL